METCASLSPTPSSSPFEVASLLKELSRLSQEVEEKEELIDLQREEIETLKAQNVKLEAAVTHRETVIGQLASSRKLVFEECHKACVNSQTELRQMQEALHRVTRELQRERRKRSSVHKLGSTNICRRGSPTSTLQDIIEDLEWKSPEGDDASDDGGATDDGALSEEYLEDASSVGKSIEATTPSRGLPKLKVVRMKGCWGEKDAPLRDGCGTMDAAGARDRNAIFQKLVDEDDGAGSEEDEELEDELIDLLAWS